MKKVLLSLAAAGTAIAMVPLFAAFEAHVINVTAKIENALSVPIDKITFGTVFPQEQLDRPFDVSLSQSFLEEPRVDDVSYHIRQKPKCAITTQNGTVINPQDPTRTGEVVPDTTPIGYHIDCGAPPRELVTGETWGVLPSLCPYLSKHILRPEALPTEVQVPAFHQPFTVNGSTISWLEAKGYLSKLAQRLSETWNIDLKVPCFGGYCAQDWAAYVTGINPQADPAQYTQPIQNEHKIFGCDLWVEVTGVSEALD